MVLEIDVLKGVFFFFFEVLVVSIRLCNLMGIFVEVSLVNWKYVVSFKVVSVTLIIYAMLLVQIKLLSCALYYTTTKEK